MTARQIRRGTLTLTIVAMALAYVGSGEAAPVITPAVKRAVLAQADPLIPVVPAVAPTGTIGRRTVSFRLSGIATARGRPAGYDLTFTSPGFPAKQVVFSVTEQPASDPCAKGAPVRTVNTVNVYTAFTETWAAAWRCILGPDHTLTRITAHTDTPRPRLPLDRLATLVATATPLPRIQPAAAPKHRTVPSEHGDPVAVINDAYTDGRLDHRWSCGTLRATAKRLPHDMDRSDLVQKIDTATAATCRNALAAISRGNSPAEVRSLLGQPDRQPSCWLYRWPATNTSALVGARICFTHGRVSRIQRSVHG